MTNPKIAPRVDGEGVGWCDAGCPQAIIGPFPGTSYEDLNCKISGAILRTAERHPTLPPELCPVAVKRMAEENRELQEKLTAMYRSFDGHVYVKTDKYAKMAAENRALREWAESVYSNLSAHECSWCHGARIYDNAECFACKDICAFIDTYPAAESEEECSRCGGSGEIRNFNMCTEEPQRRPFPDCLSAESGEE